jgi:RNA polymerase sigma-70 factor (ECF subfamily)
VDEQEFESVLAAAQSGAEWAWEQLFGAFHRPLVGYFRVQGARDPENLAGDVFLRAAKAIGRFEGSEARFRSWIFTIAHNRLIDERRRGHQQVYPTEDVDPGPDPGDVDLQAIGRVDSAWVGEVLAQLTDEQRSVLYLRAVSQMSIDEIAEIMSKRPGAIKALLLRGLRRARKIAAGYPHLNDDERRSLS